MGSVSQRVGQVRDGEPSVALPLGGALWQAQARVPGAPLAGLPLALPAQQVGWAMRAQRAFGNWATGEMLRVQAKLVVGDAGDALEVEADRVADRVMRMAEPVPAWDGAEARSAGDALHRKCTKCERKNEDELHRKAAGAPDAGRAESAPAVGAAGGTLEQDAMPAVLEPLSEGGQPLDPEARAYFEPRFGVDFGDVRIHTSERAARSALAVNALAYTVGHQIAFREGSYAPRTSEGRRLIAHELTHVVQQGAARAAPGVIQRAIPTPARVTDDPTSREARLHLDAAKKRLDDPTLDAATREKLSKALANAETALEQYRKTIDSTSGGLTPMMASASNPAGATIAIVAAVFLAVLSTWVVSSAPSRSKANADAAKALADALAELVRLDPFKWPPPVPVPTVTAVPTATAVPTVTPGPDPKPKPEKKTSRTIRRLSRSPSTRVAAAPTPSRSRSPRSRPGSMISRARRSSGSATS